MSRLEAKNLTKAFGGVQAIDDFSFVVDDHQIVGIIGPNAPERLRRSIIDRGI